MLGTKTLNNNMKDYLGPEMHYFGEVTLVLQDL